MKSATVTEVGEDATSATHLCPRSQNCPVGQWVEQTAEFATGLIPRRVTRFSARPAPETFPADSRPKYRFLETAVEEAFDNAIRMDNGGHGWMKWEPGIAWRLGRRTCLTGGSCDESITDHAISPSAQHFSLPISV